MIRTAKVLFCDNEHGSGKQAELVKDVIRKAEI